MNNKILIIAILIIAVFLRLYNITQVPPGLYPDEAMNGNNAIEALTTGHFKVFYPENNGREGLFINIQALFLKFLVPLSGVEPEPWMLRLPSALFGILTVLGVYFLATELFRKNLKSEILNPKQIQNSNDQNPKRFRIWNLGFRISRSQKIALLSSFFLATSFWHINFSRIGFRAIMAPFWLTWGIYFLLKSLKNCHLAADATNQIKNQKSKIKNTYQNPKIIIYSILGGAFFGIGFHSYIAYRAMPLLILMIFVLYWLKIKNSIFRTSDVPNINVNFRTSDVPKLIRKKILLVACLFSLAALIVFAPLGIYFLKNPGSFFGRTTQVSIFNSPTPLKDLGMNILKTAGMFNFMGDWNWRHNYAGRPLLFWPIGILFLIGVIIAVKGLIQKSPPKADLRRRRMGLWRTPLAEKIKNQSGNSKFKNEFTNPPAADTKILTFEFCILISWLIIAAIPVVISNEGLPHALRAILMVPPVFILAGFGGIWLLKKIKNQISNIKITNQNSKILDFLIHISLFIILSLLVFEAYYTYFVEWANNPNTQGAFSTDYAQIGYELRKMPDSVPKYVIVEAPGINVRGIPMPAQTVMFLTDTFTPEKQTAKNIHYILPQEVSKIPVGAYTVYIN